MNLLKKDKLIFRILLALISLCYATTLGVAETPPPYGDPGWQPTLYHAKCDAQKSYHCSSAPCTILKVFEGKVEYCGQQVDVSGYLNFTIVGSIVPYTNALFECTVDQYLPDSDQCQDHGAGCGQFQVVAGSCSNGVAVGTVIWIGVGWQLTCDNPI